MANSTTKLNLSEHTLDINVRNYDVEQFDFADIEEYVRELTGDRQYQFKAIKEIMIYLWGGRYKTITDLAKENFKKSAIQQRFQSEEHFLNMLPLPDRLSGVCHMATGTGKSYIMFAIAYLSILLGKTKRVLVLGPPSTVIEAGLRAKFKEYMYGKTAMRLKEYLPSDVRNKTIRLLNCNDPIEDDSIVIENINAIYNRENNSIGDTLFSHHEDVLVLSDEVHHAYSHLSFAGDVVQYDFEDGKEGKGEQRDERLWMKFLREEKQITRHIGFTGTPYNQNEYFVDVICNYSIKDATDEKIIKTINPIIKTEKDEGEGDITQPQKFQQILQTHDANKSKYSYTGHDGKLKIKPITIFINPSISRAEKNTDDFVKVLADYMKEGNKKLQNIARSQLEEIARQKVICVTSKAGDADYQQKLDQIEEIDPAKTGGKVEFIFAVNKLSEGWDVDNVFQIVPMEEKVFNSKLLISQVLGRGLRLPRNVNLTGIRQNYPVVTVTNHEKFASRIRELMYEVTDCEMRFVSNAINDSSQERCKHNFNVFNLEYFPRPRKENKTPDELKNGVFRKLLLTPSKEKLGLKVTFLAGSKEFELTKEFSTFDQVVIDIERKFRNTTFESTQFDFGDGMIFKGIPGRKEIEDVIRRAMEEAGIAGNKLSRENTRQIEMFFYQYLPKAKKKIIMENVQGAVVAVSTDSMHQSSVRSGRLDHDAGVFISEDYERELDKQNQFVLSEITRQTKQLTFDDAWLKSQEDFNREYIRQLVPFKNLYIANTSLFRTPQNLVILSHEPERQFIFRLIENSKLIDSWIKSPDIEFYSLDYEYWKRGKDRVRRSFNPDFFIKIELDDYLFKLPSDASVTGIDRLRNLQNKGIKKIIFVVEIKDNEDQTDETRAKEAYGMEHFKALNTRLRETNPIDIPEQYRDSLNQHYIFNLLRPRDYPSWFSRLKTGLVVLRG